MKQTRMKKNPRYPRKQRTHKKNGNHQLPSNAKYKICHRKRDQRRTRSISPAQSCVSTKRQTEMQRYRERSKLRERWRKTQTRRQTMDNTLAASTKRRKQATPADEEKAHQERLRLLQEEKQKQEEDKLRKREQWQDRRAISKFENSKSRTSG